MTQGNSAAKEQLYRQLKIQKQKELQRKRSQTQGLADFFNPNPRGETDWKMRMNRESFQARHPISKQCALQYGITAAGSNT